MTCQRPLRKFVAEMRLQPGTSQVFLLATVPHLAFAEKKQNCGLNTNLKTLVIWMLVCHDFPIPSQAIQVLMQGFAVKLQFSVFFSVLPGTLNYAPHPKFGHFSLDIQTSYFTYVGGDLLTSLPIWNMCTCNSM